MVYTSILFVSEFQCITGGSPGETPATLPYQFLTQSTSLLSLRAFYGTCFVCACSKTWLC